MVTSFSIKVCRKCKSEEQIILGNRITHPATPAKSQTNLIGLFRSSYVALADSKNTYMGSKETKRLSFQIQNVICLSEHSKLQFPFLEKHLSNPYYNATDHQFYRQFLRNKLLRFGQHTMNRAQSEATPRVIYLDSPETPHYDIYSEDSLANQSEPFPKRKMIKKTKKTPSEPIRQMHLPTHLQMNSPKRIALTEGERQSEPQKRTRNIRCSIPKVTLIDRVTREPIGERQLYYPMTSATPDANLIEELNRLLVQNGAVYSSLLGKQNNQPPKIPSFIQLAPSDGQFPQIWSVCTARMREAFMRDGREFVHVVECPAKIKMVDDAVAFGLSPTNSRYFLFGSFALTSNLNPELVSLTFATDRAMEYMLEDVHVAILRHLIIANNPEKVDKMEQEIQRKQFTKRKPKQVEYIEDYEFFVPSTVYYSPNQTFLNAVNRVKQQFSVCITVQASYEWRLEKMKSKFYRHELKRQKEVLEEGQSLIELMLESNSAIEFDECLLRLSSHNQDFLRRIDKFNLKDLCFLYFKPKFIGFHSFQRYEVIFNTYLNNLANKNGGTLRSILLSVLDIRRNQPLQSHNYSRISNKVQAQISLIKRKCEKVKCRKVGEVYYVGEQQTKVMKGINWACECGFSLKVGIPCIHLMRTFLEEKLDYSCYVDQRHFCCEVVVEID